MSAGGYEVHEVEVSDRHQVSTCLDVDSVLLDRVASIASGKPTNEELASASFTDLHLTAGRHESSIHQGHAV